MKCPWQQWAQADDTHLVMQGLDLLRWATGMLKPFGSVLIVRPSLALTAQTAVASMRRWPAGATCNPHSYLPVDTRLQVQSPHKSPRSEVALGTSFTAAFLWPCSFVCQICLPISSFIHSKSLYICLPNLSAKKAYRDKRSQIPGLVWRIGFQASWPGSV